MIRKPERAVVRKRKHKRVRKKIKGSSERPRLNVFRSLKNIYVQIINDIDGCTLVSASTMDPEIRGSFVNGGNKQAAKIVGELIAKRAVAQGITKVVFDRGGYLYHGRVKELADSARSAGLEF